MTCATLQCRMRYHERPDRVTGMGIGFSPTEEKQHGKTSFRSHAPVCSGEPFPCCTRSRRAYLSMYCSAGKVGIDVFISRSAKSQVSHRSADCALVAEAWAQWDRLRGTCVCRFPGTMKCGAEAGPPCPTSVSTPVSRSRPGPTKRSPSGTGTTGLPRMQLLFQPPAPICRTHDSGPRRGLRLPFNATRARWMPPAARTQATPRPLRHAGLRVMCSPPLTCGRDHVQQVLRTLRQKGGCTHHARGARCQAGRCSESKRLGSWKQPGHLGDGSWAT